MATRGDFHWTAYEHQRPPPPLPSLPPWAAAASSATTTATPIQSVSRPQENGDAAQGGAWRRPTSYFGAMKRLPFQAAPTGYEMPPNDDEEQRRFAQHDAGVQPQYPPQYAHQPHQQPQYQPPYQQLQQPLYAQPQYQPQYQQQNQPQYEPQHHQQTLSQPLLHPQQQQQEQQQQKQPERLSDRRREWLFGNGAAPEDSGAATNQHEDEPAANDAVSESSNDAAPRDSQKDAAQPAPHDPKTTETAEVAPLAMDGAFFRPWKSASETNNNNYEEDSGEQTANKWKVRALFNPFAKRKAPTRATPFIQEQQQQPEPVVLPQSQSPKRGNPFSERPQDDEDENLAAASPIPMVRTKAAPRRVVARRPEPLPPSEPVPVRPPTPVLAPAPIAMPSEPAYERQSGSSQQRPLRPLRSREAKQLPQLSAPPSVAPETHNELPKAFANITDLRRSTAVLAPIEAADSRPHSRDISPENDDAEDEDAVVKVLKSVPAKPPTQLQQLKQQQKQSQQKAKKGATLDALKEIQRKRDERRNAQAEEKQRIQSELKAHGDDAGYKFRRLIQKLRDALPAHQKPGQAKSSADPTAATPPPSSSSQRLSVFVRKRPLAKKELKAKGYDILTCLFAGAKAQPFRTELMCHEPKLKVDCSETLENHKFHFDGVFDDDQDNTAVYNTALGPMVPFLVQGSASTASSSSTASLTVFAYGQTGSGKTYTMKSMYRQAAGDLFARLSGLTVSVGVSFYEIYMNQVNDLLNQRTRVQVMEDGDGVVQLQGLKEISITSADELMELIQIGEESRATSANAVHDDSSRSHALLRVTIYHSDAKNDGAVLARLSMVDLAGSERACDTQSDSKSTRMEGAEINKSLLALKECIRALDRGATHIPFRQSKLTQLLRDSFLCANSKTVMIATVSPWSESCNHTLNTLRYADRLKEIGSS